MLKLLLITILLVTIDNSKATGSNSDNVDKTIRPLVSQFGYFRTKLDHFRPQDERTIQFTYNYVDLFHEPYVGPLFFYIKDAGETTTNWIEEGLMVDIAVQAGAALLTTDHRFFGTNIPTENATLDSLRYLTVEQNLADIAHFITVAKTDFSTYYSRIIVWGSGWGGTLAGWARKKYPHLIDAAWSSSGMYQLRPYSDSFYDALSVNFRIYGPGECANLIEFAFNTIDYLIEDGQGVYLSNTFNLCDELDVTSENAVAMFLEHQINFIASYVNQHHIFGILDICRDINFYNFDPYNSLARWVQFRHGATLDCFDQDFTRTIERYSQEEWNQMEADDTYYFGRQSFYLSCSQIGFMRTTSDYSLFPHRINIEYFFETCQQLFGPNFIYYMIWEALYELDIQYGALQPATTNVIYTNGQLDPYFYQGITSVPQYGSYILNIPYHAKSADLASIGSWQAPALIETKNRIVELILGWV